MTEHERMRISLASKGLDKLFHYIDVKLDENKEKPLWTEVDIGVLLQALVEEMGELLDAIQQKLPKKEVWREAADVGALAMMAAQCYEVLADERN